MFTCKNSCFSQRNYNMRREGKLYFKSFAKTKYLSGEHKSFASEYNVHTKKLHLLGKHLRCLFCVFTRETGDGEKKLFSMLLQKMQSFVSEHKNHLWMVYIYIGLILLRASVKCYRGNTVILQVNAKDLWANTKFLRGSQNSSENALHSHKKSVCSPKKLHLRAFTSKLFFVVCFVFWWECKSV